jgi:hypothetical protein
MVQSPKEAIDKTREFIELWKKFNQIYKEAMGKAAITEEEEDLFLETKSIVARKFQTLVDSLAVERPTIERTYDVINQILSLKSISTISEQALAKLNNDWHQSYISLNRLLGHLEAQRNDAAKRFRIDMKKIPDLIGKFILYVVFIALLLMVILFLARVLLNAAV